MSLSLEEKPKNEKIEKNDKGNKMEKMGEQMENEIDLNYNNKIINMDEE